MPQTTLTVIQAALRLCGEMGMPGRISAPEQQVEGLYYFQNLLDHYSINRNWIYSVTDNTYTLTPSVQQYLIGPGATPQIIGGVQYGAINANRPNSILTANLIYQTQPFQRLAMQLIDYNQWAAILTPQIFAIPELLYYDHGYSQSIVVGLGVINLWPGPQSNYQLEIFTTAPLSNGNVQLTDVLQFPPGYLRALTFLLAMEHIGLYREGLNAERLVWLEARCEESRRILEATNAPNPLAAMDPGMGGNRGTENFNWLVSLG